MKYIPLLFVLLASCAVSEEQLITEAKECVSNTRNVNAQGIVTKPTDTQTRVCWSEFNKREEISAKRALKREQEAAGKCPNGYVMFCSRGDCSCASDREFRDWMRRNGLGY